MSRVFAYARVSTVDQLTENQAEQIAQAGCSIQPKRYIEEKVSGSVSTAQRAGFQKLMDRMEEGDTLIVTKLDRIGRDSIDVQQTVKRCAERGIRLVVLQLGNLDLTSSAGELMVKVLAAVADFERDLIIERTQAGQWPDGQRADVAELGPLLAADTQKVALKVCKGTPHATVTQVVQTLQARGVSVSVDTAAPARCG